MKRYAPVVSLTLLLSACSTLPDAPEPTRVESTVFVLRTDEPEFVEVTPARSGSSGFVITSNAVASTSTPSTAPRVISPCRLPAVEHLDTARIYAAGAYKGRTLDFRISQGSHTATQFDVLVNSPDAPVALLLGAYEPSIWNIEWTEGTRILAVVTAGYHRQRVTGIDIATIPVLLSSYEDGGPCDYFYIAGDGEGRINPVAQHLFGRPVDLAYQADGAGRVVIGDIPPPGTPVMRGEGPEPETFRE